MLPINFRDRYRRYKDDTSIFATWLQHASAVCGYQASVTEPRTTAQAKKDNPELIITHTVKELVSKAKAIVNCTTVKVKLPLYALHAAQRAVEARQQFYKHFSQLDVGDPANESHEYFNRSLSEALTVLAPLSEYVSCTIIEPL